MTCRITEKETEQCVTNRQFQANCISLCAKHCQDWIQLLTRDLPGYAEVSFETGRAQLSIYRILFEVVSQSEEAQQGLVVEDFSIDTGLRTTSYYQARSPIEAVPQRLTTGELCQRLVVSEQQRHDLGGPDFWENGLCAALDNEGLVRIHVYVLFYQTPSLLNPRPWRSRQPGRVSRVLGFRFRGAPSVEPWLVPNTEWHALSGGQAMQLTCQGVDEWTYAVSTTIEIQKEQVAPTPQSLAVPSLPRAQQIPERTPALPSLVIRLLA